MSDKAHKKDDTLVRIGDTIVRHELPDSVTQVVGCFTLSVIAIVFSIAAAVIVVVKVIR